MKLKSCFRLRQGFGGHVGLIIMLLTFFVGQSSLISQSRQIDLELTEASKAGDVNRVKSLIEAGANVDATGNYGDTSLGLASLNGHIEIVRELLKAGADINATTHFGRTALMNASLFNRIDVVKELIKAGANVNAISFFGKTALIEANLSGYSEVENLLETINEVENSMSQEEFINKSDEIKNILISRWINLYKESRSKLLTDRLKMAELVAKENERDKIRRILSKLDVKRPEDFTDIYIQTVS